MEREPRMAEGSGEVNQQRIVVSGASGLIGRALCSALEARGATLIRLTRGRRDDTAGVAHWDPEKGEIDAARLEGCAAVIHLAGENIASGRWNKERKERILRSRVAGTHLLATTLAALSAPPQILLTASAVGYYGRYRGEPVGETASPGDGFLALVCREWEEAARPAAQAGITVTRMRFGVVLAEGAGVLKPLPIFKLGLGGILGSGTQLINWIALDDCINAILSLIEHRTEGAVNIVAPQPVSNAEFTKSLAHVLQKPAPLPVPAFVLRAALGELADELLLSSVHVRPEVLQQAGFQYQHPEIEGALRYVLGRP